MTAPSAPTVSPPAATSRSAIQPGAGRRRRWSPRAVHGHIRQPHLDRHLHRRRPVQLRQYHSARRRHHRQFQRQRFNLGDLQLSMATCSNYGTALTSGTGHLQHRARRADRRRQHDDLRRRHLQYRPQHHRTAAPETTASATRHRLTFGGPSTFVLSNGIYNSGGCETLSMGSRVTSNSYQIGQEHHRQPTGNAFYLGGGSNTTLGDATGTGNVFQVVGMVNVSSGGGSCLTLAGRDRARHQRKFLDRRRHHARRRRLYGQWLCRARRQWRRRCDLRRYDRGDEWQPASPSSSRRRPRHRPAPARARRSASPPATAMSPWWRPAPGPRDGPGRDRADLPRPTLPVRPLPRASSNTSLSGVFYLPYGRFTLSGGSSVGNGTGQCLELIGSQVTQTGGTTVATTCSGLGGLSTSSTRYRPGAVIAGWRMPCVDHRDAATQAFGKRHNAGVAAVEFGLLAPTFVLVFAGTVDCRRCGGRADPLDSAVAAGINYALVNQQRRDLVDQLLYGQRICRGSGDQHRQSRLDQCWRHCGERHCRGEQRADRDNHQWHAGNQWHHLEREPVLLPDRIAVELGLGDQRHQRRRCLLRQRNVPESSLPSRLATTSRHSSTPTRSGWVARSPLERPRRSNDTPGAQAAGGPRWRGRDGIRHRRLGVDDAHARHH